MTDNQFYIDKLTARCAAEIAEWKQAASVEASLRREFYDRALTAEASLQESYADHRKQKARIEELEKALRDAIVLLESSPQPTAGLVGNSVQADFNKRLAAARAALSGGVARSLSMPTET